MVLVPVWTGTRWCRSVRRAGLYNIYTLLLSTLLTLKTPSPLSAVILWSVEDELVACTSDTVWRSYVDVSFGMLGCPSCTAECCLNIPRWGSHICTYKCMSLCQKKPDWYEDIFCRLKAHTVLTFWSWKINLSGISPTKCSRSGSTGLQYVDTRQVGKGWQRWVNFGHDGPILPVTVR